MNMPNIYHGLDPKILYEQNALQLMQYSADIFPSALTSLVPSVSTVLGVCQRSVLFCFSLLQGGKL